MSYSLDTMLSASSYRRALGADPARSAASRSLASSGFYSHSWSRSVGSVPASKRSAGGLGSQVTVSSESLGEVALLNGEARARNEKETLQALNDRFATYIDKVRSLELQNKNLEAEAASLRQQQAGRSAIGELYEREIRDLRTLLVQVSNDKAQLQLEQEHLDEDIQHVRQRYDDESRLREEIDASVRSLAKYAEDAGLLKLDLGKKLQFLSDEASAMRAGHQDEVRDLLSQIQGSQVTLEVRDSLKSDITAALREIRAQMEGHAVTTTSQTEEVFRVKLEKLNQAAKVNTDAIHAAQDEILEYRRHLQSKNTELETLKGTKDSLERQMYEMEDRHNADLSSYQ
eukprot:g43885.t1